MTISQVCFVLVLAAFAIGSPASKPAFWKGTALDTTIEEMRALCANEDAIACLKYKFMSVLDNFFQKDAFQITENIEVTRNSFRANEVSSRSESDLESNIQEYLQSHDVTFKLGGSSVTVGARNLDQDEVDLKLRFSESQSGVQEARGKSKLKKIIVPIFIFILLKAITLIPLALGVLGLKAWNALQLSFFSFVISIGLAVFQLCKKIAADGAHPQIAAHGPWDAHYARSFDTQPVNSPNEEEAQKMAYAAYV